MAHLYRTVFSDYMYIWTDFNNTSRQQSMPTLSLAKITLKYSKSRTKYPIHFSNYVSCATLSSEMSDDDITPQIADSTRAFVGHTLPIRLPPILLRLLLLKWRQTRKIRQRRGRTGPPGLRWLARSFARRRWHRSNSAPKKKWVRMGWNKICYTLPSLGTIARSTERRRSNTQVN